MNLSMIRRLVLKDWYLYRWPILASVAGGVISLGIIAYGGKPGFHFGLTIAVTILAFIGALLPISTIIQERKEQTLPFVMSLPISYLEYTAAKILANLLIFLVPWLTLVLGGFALIMTKPVMPHGLVPFFAIMSMEILVSTCLIFAVALMTESQGWTIGAILVGNLALNLVGYFVAHIPSVGSGLWGSAIQWSPAATILLGTEWALIVLILGLAFFVQSRKRDFV
jgi:hypothetical protein